MMRLIVCLITENFGLDSNYQAMNWFANGELLIKQHKYKSAFNLFDSISLVYLEMVLMKF